MKNISELFNKKVFSIAFIIWTILNISGIQSIYFIEQTSLKISIIKILHLFFLYAIFFKIYSLYTQKHIPKIKTEIKISIICFLILSALVLLTWPGTWSWDDITVLKNASAYDMTPWQHFFSGLFQILCLQTIPIPTGVIIIQIVIASLIAGYSISNISILYTRNEKQKRIIQIILCGILLMPPLTMYILCGFRMGLYTFFEIFLITKMLVLYKEQKKATFKDILEIIFAAIIVSCWRTEALYYPVFILIICLILNKKIISRKVSLITFFIIIIATISVGKINNQMIGNNNYSLTATVEPIVNIIRTSDETDQNEIDCIDKVIDVKYVLENPDATGEACYWKTGVVRNYSEEEYSEYLKAYLKLSLKYPEVAIKSMWNIFENTANGFGENSKQTNRNMVVEASTLKLFDTQNGAGQLWSQVVSKAEKAKSPINLKIRNTVIELLAGIDSEGNLTIVHNIFWNLFIPFTLILICALYKLIKKEWFMLFLIGAVIARIPLVFATASAPYFMYYLSAYTCCYWISAIVIFEFITNLIDKNKHTDKNQKQTKGENIKEKIIRIFKQFLSFLLVSGVGWIIDFSIYIILTNFGNLNVGIANVLSSIPAITYVFIMSNKKIFKNINSKLSLNIKYIIYFGYQFVLLFCISLLGEFLYGKLINVITIPFLINNLKIVIKILITPITMTMNFIVMKNLIEKL